MKIYIAFLSLFFAIHNIMFVLYALPTRSYEHVQENQKKIADVLIPLSKEYPVKKDDIYKALDNLNSICQVCKTCVEESSLLHERQQRKATGVSALKSKNARLKHHITELQHKLSESEKIIQEQAELLQKITLERDDLEQQVHASLEKEKTMANHIKALQETFQGEHVSQEYTERVRDGGKPAFSDEEGTRNTK